MNEDRELREQFAALRTEEEARLPSFSRFSARPAAVRLSWRPRRWAWVAGGVSLALAAAAAWLVQAPSAPAWDSAAVAREILAWQAETDYLLETPGAELYSAIPVFGPEAVAVPGFQRPARRPPP